MKNKKRITTLFLTLFLILGVAALITKAIYYKYEKESGANSSTTTSGIPIEPSATAPFSNTSEEGYSKYENKVYKFSILYPTSLKRIDPAAVGDLDNLDSKNIFVGEIPKDTFEGTNLRSVHIIAGAKKTDKNTCTKEIYGNPANDDNSNMDVHEVTINNNRFIHVEFGEGAAGSFFRTDRYSIYKNDTCYELLAVAASANPPDYKKSLYLTEFEEIVSFFTFLD